MKRLVKHALPYTSKEARLPTTGRSDLEHNQNVGQVSTIMRHITNTDGGLLSCFDKINENDIDDTSLQKTH